MSPPVGVEVFSAEEALAFLADRTGLADPAGASLASTTVSRARADQHPGLQHRGQGQGQGEPRVAGSLTGSQ